MGDEKLKILEMLEKGTITAADAGRLLETLNPAPSRQKAPRSFFPQLRGKKLRVEVRGVSKGERVNVSFSVPLALAKYAGTMLSGVLPPEALRSLEAQGLSLEHLDLGDLAGTVETLEEELIHMDIGREGEGTDLRMRIYVE